MLSPVLCTKLLIQATTLQARPNVQNRSRSLEDHTQRRSLHSNNFTAITHLLHELIQRQPVSLKHVDHLLPTNTSRRPCIYERIFVLDHSAECPFTTCLKICRIQPEVNIRSIIDSCSLCDLCKPVCAIDLQLGDSKTRICCRQANDDCAVIVCVICTCDDTAGLGPGQFVDLEQCACARVSSSATKEFVTKCVPTKSDISIGIQVRCFPRAVDSKNRKADIVARR